MVERCLRGRARVSQHAKVRNDGVVVACGGTGRGKYGTPEPDVRTAAVQCLAPRVKNVALCHRYAQHAGGWYAFPAGTARLRASSKEARLRASSKEVRLRASSKEARLRHSKAL